MYTSDITLLPATARRTTPPGPATFESRLAGRLCRLLGVRPDARHGDLTQLLARLAEVAAQAAAEADSQSAAVGAHRILWDATLGTLAEAELPGMPLAAAAAGLAWRLISARAVPLAVDADVTSVSLMSSIKSDGRTHSLLMLPAAWPALFAADWRDGVLQVAGAAARLRDAWERAAVTALFGPAAAEDAALTAAGLQPDDAAALAHAAAALQGHPRRLRDQVWALHLALLRAFMADAPAWRPALDYHLHLLAWADHPDGLAALARLNGPAGLAGSDGRPVPEFSLGRCAALFGSYDILADYPLREPVLWHFAGATGGGTDRDQ